MARLHEYQAKEILRHHGIAVPKGRIVRPDEREGATFPLPAVVKAQVWTTSRMAKGLVLFADSRDAVWDAVANLLGRTVDAFPVEDVLVEERLHVEEEYFFSYFVDDDAAVGKFLFATTGGSGVEETLTAEQGGVADGRVETWKATPVHHVRETLRRAGVHGRALLELSDLVFRALEAARAIEARSLEINPIVRTADGAYVAADCRIVVDDYAVFRHPELGVDMARDLPHPPTALDRVAYEVERDDYRGTFYFAQLARGFTRGDRYVGFHGAGGGGSMMSMDALAEYGFRAANYCDTSGNPPASKVYRAACIIAAQPGIVAYFGSGSGVASHEQVHSARGLVKAFRTIAMRVPAVVRLGGNMETEAVRILEHYTRDLPAPIRAFTKDTTVTECVAVLARLVDEGSQSEPEPKASEQAVRAVSRIPEWCSDESTYTFASPTGRVYYHHPTCLGCTSKACIASCAPGILRLRDGVPELAVTAQEARAGKCIECLACEVECREHGAGGGFVDLPIPGLLDAVEESVGGEP